MSAPLLAPWRGLFLWGSEWAGAQCCGNYMQFPACGRGVARGGPSGETLCVYPFPGPVAREGELCEVVQGCCVLSSTWHGAGLKCDAAGFQERFLPAGLQRDQLVQCLHGRRANPPGRHSRLFNPETCPAQELSLCGLRFSTPLLPAHTAQPGCRLHRSEASQSHVCP